MFASLWVVLYGVRLWGTADVKNVHFNQSFANGYIVCIFKMYFSSHTNSELHILLCKYKIKLLIVFTTVMTCNYCLLCREPDSIQKGKSMWFSYNKNCCLPHFLRLKTWLKKATLYNLLFKNIYHISVICLRVRLYHKFNDRLHKHNLLKKYNSSTGIRFRK
jgi:hypothetical protein